MRVEKRSGRWVLAILTGSSSFAASAGAQLDCDAELCVITETPPPCASQNDDFDDQGCPDDFENSDMDFCFDDSEVPGYPSIDVGDGQLFAVDEDRIRDCGVLRVKETGYYAIFDTELSESCADQKDETGYLTVENGCNPEGWATQSNVGDHYLVTDTDNEGTDCESDLDCGAGSVCRSNGHGTCCVPSEPVYMGTFLLNAGEDNILCINHWCPKAMEEDGPYSGVLITDECETVNSIHFKIAATAFLCKQEGYIEPCHGGCATGECVAHPCLDVACEDFCRADAVGGAECVSENPCENRTDCAWGCAFGLCLQPPDARGPDTDGDGFSVLADCDDNDAAVNPGATEIGGNGKDDNCNGVVDADEGTSGSAANLDPDGSFGPGYQGPNSSAGDGDQDGNGSGDPVSGAAGESGAAADGAADSPGDGCSCRTAGTGVERTGGATIWGLVALFGLGWLSRRRRHTTGEPEPRR